ncbi:MAG: ABC transporter ATP-binding protein [Burkholderiales bacterium]|nr:ABC transporter ATP-binding protein [Burkholderiales bacterium]MCE2909613.1 ABC transporter ATP-binding protein [Burkholderiaceae bacterium]
MKPVARPVLRVDGLRKCYFVYAQPRDRLKQFVLPRAARLLGRPARAYYREFWALQGVSFSVAPGETVGIVGRNGSGKSTLLQLICGTLSPSGGTVAVDGRIAALLELGSGFNPEFSGRENVFLNAAILGLTRAQTEARLPEILAFAEIGEFIDQPVKTYSSGMVVRLAFAVAIHVEPQLLVIDEALSVGDERFQRKCFARIEAMRRAGVAVLFVSHSAGTVVELCDRALLLDGGELLAAGEPKRVVAAYQKLLYAPPEQAASVRAALRAGTPVAAPEPAAAVEPPVPVAVDEREAFDPGLRPTSTLEYEPRGARILQARVLNARGEPVNHLVRSRRYCYTYRVAFDRTCTHVRFGMLLKTLTGLEIGGASSSAPGTPTLALAPAGSEVEVAFDFTCNLAAGVYFLNAGVGAGIDGGETYIHRVVDAAMFRVAPEAEDRLTGVVDFGISARVTSAAVAAAQAATAGA